MMHVRFVGDIGATKDANESVRASSYVNQHMCVNRGENERGKVIEEVEGWGRLYHSLGYHRTNEISHCGRQTDV
jgi:hypothetical protein